MLPSAGREKLHSMVDLDDPEVWAQTLQDRAEYFRKATPMALENLAIAQHRDACVMLALEVGLIGLSFGGSG